MFFKSDGVTMKSKAMNKSLILVTLKLSLSEKQIFEKKKKKIQPEMFIFLVNLFTPSLIFVLYPSYLIHYCKSYVNRYTTGVTKGHTFKFEILNCFK